MAWGVVRVLCGLFLATGVRGTLSAARMMSSVTAGLVRRCTRVETRTGLAGVTVVVELRTIKVLRRLAMHTVEMSIIPER